MQSSCGCAASEQRCCVRGQHGPLPPPSGEQQPTSKRTSTLKTKIYDSNDNDNVINITINTNNITIAFATTNGATTTNNN